MKKNIVITVLFFAVAIILNIVIWNYHPKFSEESKTLYLDVESSQDAVFTLSYGDQSLTNYFSAGEDGKGTIAFPVPLGYDTYRLEYDAQGHEIRITDCYYQYYLSRRTLPGSFDMDEGTLQGALLSEDLNEIQREYQNRLNPVFCVILDLALFVLWRSRKRILALSKELLLSRKIILSLGKNDFKTKFAGSYLGIVWAFVQPVVTVFVYWFVFQVGLRSTPVGNFPFVLWLVAGLVPWFFFSDAWIAGNNSMIDYSYLVKKVVFNVSTIPIVKILSTLFIHIFFVCFMMILFVCYGFFPSIYWIQAVYYSICMIAMVLAFSYLTSAIAVFFRDLSQIINIVLQVGIWGTGIMWSVDMLPEKYRWLMNFNPMYYVVNGYRKALIYKEWFWESAYQTIGFWSFVILMLCFGVTVFQKLRVHFADVL